MSVGDRSALEMTEAQWQLLIVSFAQLHGWWVYHPHDSRRSEAGFPDLTLARGGELVFIECKKHNGKVSDDQARVLALLEDTGAEVHVYRPADEEEVRARLSAPRVPSIRALHAAAGLNPDWVKRRLAMEGRRP